MLEVYANPSLIVSAAMMGCMAGEPLHQLGEMSRRSMPEAIDAQNRVCVN